MRYRFVILMYMFVIFLTYFGGVISFPHADVFYPEGYKNIAILVGNIFENIREQVIELIGNDPGKVVFIIKDKGTISNGIANPIVHKTIQLYVWPPENWIYFQLPIEDWYRYLIIHEFTHITHLTLQGDKIKKLSGVLGIPIYPNLFGTFLEGVTLFSESHFSKQSGRLNSPVFSIGLYNYSVHNFPSLTYAISDPTDDFRVGLLYYNFIGGFYKYLVDTYGLDKVKSFHKKISEKIPLFNENKIFREIFGKNESEIYSEWIQTLELNREESNHINEYPIYYLKNGWIRKIEASDKKIIILTNQYGPVTSYDTIVLKSIVGLSENGNKLFKKEVSWIDFKVVGKNYFILKKVNRFGKIISQIWKVSKNGFKSQLVAEGYISSFAIDNGNLYISYYDPKTMTTTIEGLNIKITKFVRYMTANNKKIALLTLDNKILIYKNSGKLLQEISDTSMKGPYIRFWKDGIIFTRKDDSYMNAYYYDLKSNKLYKLTEKSFIMDFIIKDEFIFYISYFDGKGTALYKSSYKLSKSDCKNETYSFNDKNFPYKKVRNKLGKKLSIFIQPIIRSPVPAFSISNNEKYIGLGWLYVFSNPEMTNIVGVFPSIIYEYEKSIISGRFLGFYLMNFDAFNLQAIYNSFNNYSFVLFNFHTNILELNSEWTLGTFSSIKIENPPIESSFTLGLNFHNTTKKFTVGVVHKFYPVQKTMLETNIELTLTKYSGIKANFIVPLENSSFTYDISTALTLKSESSEWWHFIFKNSGVVFGLSNQTLYSHIFQEIYFTKLKFYTKVGIKVDFDNPIKFYFGIDLTPYSLPKF